MQHDAIADQMAIGRHQHPLMQHLEGATTKHHGVGVDKVFWISEWAGAHHRAVQATERAAGGDEVGLVMVHFLQKICDVVWPVPVVCIEKGHGVHAQADGVVATDQAGC